MRPERKGSPLERIRDVTNEYKMRVAVVADALSDLKEASRLYAEGDVRTAFEHLLFVFECHIRRQPEGIVGSEEVTSEGAILEPGCEEKLSHLLYVEGVGPLPPRKIRPVPPTE